MESRTDDDGLRHREVWRAVELLDAGGAPFASYRYSVWGAPRGGEAGVCSRATAALTADLASDLAKRQVLRYCGYAFDAASGLYYCSARYYDPVSGQFTSRDPAAADGAESAYQYASGVPTLASDPTGERPYEPGYVFHWKAAQKRWVPVRIGGAKP